MAKRTENFLTTEKLTEVIKFRQIKKFKFSSNKVHWQISSFFTQIARHFAVFRANALVTSRAGKPVFFCSWILDKENTNRHLLRSCH